jgi:hypothetical protein
MPKKPKTVVVVVIRNLLVSTREGSGKEKPASAGNNRYSLSEVTRYGALVISFMYKLFEMYFS